MYYRRRKDPAVAGPDLLVGGDAQADDIDLCVRLLDEVVEPLPEQSARPVQTRGVHEDQLRMRAMHDAADRVPSRLRTARRDRDLRSH